MSTAKMIHRFIESKINKHKHFHKLSGPRIGVLFVVHESGVIRMGDLAAKLQVAPRTATDIVDGLERDGFLQRRSDPSDRRAMLLELTAHARSDMDKISSLRKAFVEEVFGHMSEEERTELIALLTKVKQGPLSTMLQNQLKQDSAEGEI
jgi:DNA-binding MarR family transcriptional regulator